MDFRDTGQGADDMTAGMMTDVLEKVAEAAKAEIAETKKGASSNTVDARRFNVVTDSSRDALLT